MFTTKVFFLHSKPIKEAPYFKALVLRKQNLQLVFCNTKYSFGSHSSALRSIHILGRHFGFWHLTNISSAPFVFSFYDLQNEFSHDRSSRLTLAPQSTVTYVVTYLLVYNNEASDLELERFEYIYLVMIFCPLYCCIFKVS